MKQGYGFVLVLMTITMAGCGGGGGYGSGSGGSSYSSSSATSSASSSSSSVVALKSLTATLGFPFGVAVGGPGDQDNIFATNNTQMMTVVPAQFDLVVPGNIMKMKYLDPGPTQNSNDFTFTDADNLYNFAHTNGLKLHGHTLIWHSAYQVPAFMSSFSGTPSQWDAILTTHVQTIVSHFAGKVDSWDVVNEAIDETQTDGWRHSLFYVNSGNSSVFIENAFKNARASDGAAKLYYNDYNMESSTTKLNFMLAMVGDFQTRSVPIDGIGFQMHVSLTFPDINTMKAAWLAVVNKGLLVRLSELDVAVNGSGTLTSLDPTTAAAQKQRYHDIVQAYLDTVPMAQRGGITVWGLLDGYSWLIGFEGHPEWPLLFNDNYTTKPAFDGVATALQGL